MLSFYRYNRGVTTLLQGAAGFAAAYWLLYPLVLPRLPSLRAAVAAGVLLALVPFPESLRRRVAPQPWEAPAPHRPRPEVVRFTGPRPEFAASGPAEAGFIPGRAAGTPAWLDEKDGLIWGEPLAGRFAYDLASFEAARRACAAAPPAGAWALPTMAEHLRLRGRVLPEAAGARWLSAVIIRDMNLTTMGLFGSAASRNDGGSAAQVRARCVTRGAAAPDQGYVELSAQESLEALGGRP
jgi:hypothetical protein